MSESTENPAKNWRIWSVLLASYFGLVPLLALILMDSDLLTMSQMQGLFRSLAFIGFFVGAALIVLVVLAWKRSTPSRSVKQAIFWWILLAGPLGLARSVFLLTDGNPAS